MTCPYIQQSVLLHNSFKPKWISLHRPTYKTGFVLWIDHNQEDIPRFAVVKDICIVKHINIFLVHH